MAAWNCVKVPRRAAQGRVILGSRMDRRLATSRQIERRREELVELVGGASALSPELIRLIEEAAAVHVLARATLSGATLEVQDGVIAGPAHVAYMQASRRERFLLEQITEQAREPTHGSEAHAGEV
jgi:hypothetical protein